MATLTTLRPDGTGTLSLVNDEGGGTTDIHLKVDDDPDSPTTTDYIKNSNDTTGDKTAFLLMTATDADFSTMTTLQVDAHIAVSAFSDDTCTLFARMYQSDETTTLTDEVQVATQAQTGLRSISFTGVSAGSKTIWDGARLRLRWAYARTKGADAGQLRVTAVELDGTYAAAAPNVDKSDSDSGTLADTSFALTVTPVGVSDSATLTDALGSLTATAAGSDAATLAESFVLAVVPASGSDSFTFTESGTPRAISSIPPDAILTQTGFTGVVGSIDEDPDSPDGSWVSSTGPNTVLRVSFGSPPQDLSTGAGLQEFRILVRP